MELVNKVKSHNIIIIKILKISTKTRSIKTRVYIYIVIYLLKHEYINTKRNKLTNLNSKTKRINHELK